MFEFQIFYFLFTTMNFQQCFIFLFRPVVSTLYVFLISYPQGDALG